MSAPLTVTVDGVTWTSTDGGETWWTVRQGDQP